MSPTSLRATRNHVVAMLCEMISIDGADALEALVMRATPFDGSLLMFFSFVASTLTASAGLQSRSSSRHGASLVPYAVWTQPSPSGEYT